MKSFILTILLFAGLLNFTQKRPVIHDKNEVTKRTIADFEKAMTAPEGELYLFGQKNNISGSYSFKITVGNRGMVISVFVLNREGGTIKMQNMLKDAVKDIRFSFKLPHNKKYTIEYTFKF